MRHTIWYTDMFVSLINAERNLYKAKELAKDGDGENSDLFRNLNIRVADLSEQIDMLVEEAREDNYPFTELEGIEFAKPSDDCEICADLFLNSRKVKVQNHYINVCKKHSQGNRPGLYEDLGWMNR